MMIPKDFQGRTFIFMLIGLIVLGLSSYGFAASQEIEEVEDLFDMSIEELMEIEVHTASRYKQSIKEAPASVTVLTSEEIRKYGYRTLLDILQSVPGFYKTYDRNYGYVGVRGFGRPGDYNSRIQLQIDGHRINDNIANGFGTMAEFYLDVDLIERIEIVRGPGSALYGSNALFAVINVITKSAKHYNGLEVSSELASHDTEKTRLTYGHTYRNDLDVLASGTYYDRDGQILYYPEFDDPATNNGHVKNDDEDSKSFFIKASISEFTLTVAQVQREKGIPTAPWGTVFGDRRTRTWDSYGLIGLTFEHDFPDDFSVLSKVAYNHYNYYGDYALDDGGTYINKDSWKGRWWIGELQFTKRLSDRHKLVWGADTQYNVRQDQKNWDSDVYLNDRRHSKSWSIYLQDEFRILENLILNAGLRRDDYDVTGNTTNPRAGLIYRLSNDTTIKFLFGKAFRAPSAYELYYNDGNATQKMNPQLNPETIKTYELVFERRLNKIYSGTVSGFYNKIEDLIDQTIDPGDGLLQFQNLSEVTAKGLEVALDGQWDNGMRGRIGYSFVRTLDKTTRATLANSPKHMINFNLIYPLLPEKLFVGVENKYMSKLKTLAGNHEDDALVTNLTLTFENDAKNMDVQVGIYNVLDVEYGHPGFGEHIQDIIEQDERTLGAKLIYRF
jgi:iron complex outermembrane receptor protein